MSDHIPFEIQLEIMKMLPVKSLIRFRSVSKHWKSNIVSSEFISNYHVNNTRPQHLLLCYRDPQALLEFQRKFVSIIDDETFSQQKFSLTATMSDNQLHKSLIVGSSQGLFCVYNYIHTNKIYKVAIWNPSIRKSVTIDVPYVLDSPYVNVIGFGVCPRASDPKIIKIAHIWDDTQIYAISCIPSQVEVFSLTSGSWRSPSSSNLPRKSIEFTDNQVVIDGFIYWRVYDRILLDHYLQRSNMIMSFDITSEDFREVFLPDNLAHHCYYDLSISKLRESLVVIEYDFNTSSLYVWLMENTVTNLFKKLYSIKFSIPINRTLKVHGFRMSGEIIIGMMNYSEEGKLIVYEPSSEHLSYINIGSQQHLCFKGSYTETLLLLDHSD